MRLILDGKINKLYVQSLCMMFFRGERFPENEENPRGTLYLRVVEKNDGVESYCELEYDKKATKSSDFSPFDKNNTRERTIKCSIGRAIFTAGKEITGKTIPWGILTGIRPSKVGAELLSCNSYDDALEILQEKYLLSKSKARLTLEVAKNETKIINKYSNQDCSLYISIPFCPTRCEYCSFISYATKKLFDLIPSYLDKLKKDIKEKLEIINTLGLKLVSIYIGGGTPTTLNELQLKQLLECISQNANINSLDEFTVECGRPDTITENKLEILKDFGVKRISVNPQTLNDFVLQKIGRKHTVKDFFSAYNLVEKADINIVNTDLIAGLDGDSIDSFKATIDKIIELNPENVTVHSFSVKKSARALENDREIYKKELDYATPSVDYAYEKLIGNGYEPYYMYRQKNTISDLENVGYAKKGTFGIYNVLMMSDLHTVFSSGAGATTKLVKNIDGKSEIYRIFSHKYPYEYLQDDKNYKNEIIEFFRK